MSLTEKVGVDIAMAAGLVEEVEWGPTGLAVVEDMVGLWRMTVWEEVASQWGDELSGGGKRDLQLVPCASVSMLVLEFGFPLWVSFVEAICTSKVKGMLSRARCNDEARGVDEYVSKLSDVRDGWII